MTILVIFLIIDKPVPEPLTYKRMSTQLQLKMFFFIHWLRSGRNQQNGLSKEATGGDICIG